MQVDVFGTPQRARQSQTWCFLREQESATSTEIIPVNSFVASLNCQIWLDYYCSCSGALCSQIPSLHVLCFADESVGQALGEDTRKYVDIMQRVVNREETVVELELDDVLAVRKGIRMITVVDFRGCEFSVDTSDCCNFCRCKLEGCVRNLRWAFCGVIFVLGWCMAEEALEVHLGGETCPAPCFSWRSFLHCKVENSLL